MSARKRAAALREQLEELIREYGQDQGDQAAFGATEGVTLSDVLEKADAYAYELACAATAEQLERTSDAIEAEVKKISGALDRAEEIRRGGP